MHQRRFAACIACLAAASLLAARAAATEFDDRVALLFRPVAAEQIALSPDGAHVAYTRQIKGDLVVEIVNVEAQKVTATLTVDEERTVMFSSEKEPARLRFLRWATPSRLVFAPSIRRFPPPPVPAPEGGAMPSPGGPLLIAPIMAADADGKNARALVDAGAFDVSYELPASMVVGIPPPTIVRSRAPHVIGFAANDREHVLIEVGGFQTELTVTPTELYRTNIHTGKTALLNDDSPFGSYGFDWQGRRRFACMPGAGGTQAIQLKGIARNARWQPIEQQVKAWPPESLRATTQNFFGERTYPLGFDFNPEIVYIASNVARDTFGVFALNLATGQRVPLRVPSARGDLPPWEGAFPSPALVFDEHLQKLAGVRVVGARPSVVWLDAELQALQQTVETTFPDGSVTILDWNAQRTCFLLRVSSGVDPGRCYVFQREAKRLLEIARRASWLEPTELNPTHLFAFDHCDGARLTGYVTLPNRSRNAAPPLIVCFAPEFPGRPHREFDPESQVLADMGFAVARLNQRGTLGFGRRNLDTSAEGIDRAALSDAVATVEWIAAHMKIDRKRVATFGRGFAGYLAVRVLQLAPDAFRCAVAVDAPLDPDGWLPAVPTASLEIQARRLLLERVASPPLDHAVHQQIETLTKPVFLVVEPGRNPRVESANARVRSKLAALGRVVEYVEVNRDFSLGLPLARARFYQRLEKFLNAHVYDYEVRVGPLIEVK